MIKNKNYIILISFSCLLVGFALSFYGCIKYSITLDERYPPDATFVKIIKHPYFSLLPRYGFQASDSSFQILAQANIGNSTNLCIIKQEKYLYSDSRFAFIGTNYLLDTNSLVKILNDQFAFLTYTTVNNKPAYSKLNIFSFEGGQDTSINASKRAIYIDGLLAEDIDLLDQNNILVCGTFLTTKNIGFRQYTFTKESNITSSFVDNSLHMVSKNFGYLKASKNNYEDIILTNAVLSGSFLFPAYSTTIISYNRTVRKEYSKDTIGMVKPLSILKINDSLCLFIGYRWLGLPNGMLYKLYDYNGNEKSKTFIVNPEENSFTKNLYDAETRKIVGAYFYGSSLIIRFINLEGAITNKKHIYDIPADQSIQVSSIHKCSDGSLLITAKIQTPNSRSQILLIKTDEDGNFK